jgi:hypothetical protein
MNAAILIALVAASAIPACIPLLRNRPVSSKYWKAAAIFALSALLQVALVVCVARQLLALDYSVRFAMIGIPTCVLALVVAKRGNDYSRGAIFSPSIGLVIWAFLITLH